MQFGTGNQKNNVFCLLIRQSFVIFVKMKTADGTFGYGHCRDMEDSYSAWKQAEIDIYIYTFTERLGIENRHLSKRQDV